MGIESQKSAAEPEESATRCRDRRAARIANRQKQLITAGQLGETGFSKSTIHDRVGSLRLHRTLYSGVYSLAPPPLSREQTWLAAILAGGQGAMLAGWSAAAHLKIAEGVATLPVHITNCGGRSRRGLTVHRRSIEPCDTAGREGILCTAAARTVLDLAAELGPEELEPILVAAHSLGILNLRRLDELVAESRGKRGITRLRSLMSTDPVRVRSKVEFAMLQIVRAAGLPEPIVNGRVAGLEVDLCWPDLRLIVEVDGYRFHGGRERANADRDREQRLAIAGWHVVRFTRDQIVESPAECADRLARIAATCSDR